MSRQYDAVPGTLHIEDLQIANTKIILQPTPTEDPNDPLNWSKPRKALNFTLAMFYSLMTYVLMDIGIVIWGNLNTELGISYQNLNNSLAANCAGLMVGCVILYPIAVKFGRRMVYLISLVFQLAGAVWFAKMQSNWENIFINVMIGIAGAISEVVVQMTIADLFFVHQRASANGLYFFTVCIGAFLAPVASGYCAASQGWRWIWWWCAIFLSTNLILVIFLFEESLYIPSFSGHGVSNVTPNRRVDSNITTRENRNYRSDTEIEQLAGGSAVFQQKSYYTRLSLTTQTGTPFIRHIYQPFIILVTFPAVTYTAIMIGMNMAWLSICQTTSSIYLLSEPYNFGSVQIGLFSLPPFIGSLVAFCYGGPLADWWILLASKRNGGVFEPEMRLHLALLCIFITPAGLICYGLGIANGAPWIVLAIGYTLYGFVFGVMCNLSLTYVVDCYQDITGDALVAVAIVRNGISTAFVFALIPWIEQQGLYDFFITVGCVSTVIVGLTIPMIWFGKQARHMTASQYRRYAQLQPISRAFDNII
ncbi:major facilitator superfamily domain-containing protein [Xylariales sp. PMI_506]|nr:major facilitator superfamily domain-containing protein [Xylariales sp. PMI_506]